MSGDADASKTRDGGFEFVAPQKIACGNAHTIYIMGKTDEVDGRGSTYRGHGVYGWGSNRHNQLGLEREDAAHKHHDGGEQKWKPFEPKPEKLPVSDMTKGNEFFEVACGGNYSLVLKSGKGEGGGLVESTLWAFGLRINGQLGTGPMKPGEYEHQTATEVVVNIPTQVGRAVVQRICCGSDHSLAIVNFVGSSGSYASAEGRVFSWGMNSYGALGTKSKADSWEPKEVWFEEDVYSTSSIDVWRNVRVKQVAAGFKHSLALANNGKSEGVVYAWGHGGNGRLGLGKHLTQQSKAWSSSAEFEPKEVKTGAGSQIKYIAAGEAHSGAVDQLGGLYTWGQGSHGRCGHGVASDACTPSRVESLLGVAISQISFGLMHSMATSVKGQLYAWGKGPATGLDVGDDAAVLTPRQVELPDHGREQVYQVATGPLHTLVLMTDGVLYCFGSGSENRMVSAVAAEEQVRRDQAFPKKLREDNCNGWSLKRSREVVMESSRSHSALQDRKQHKDKDWWPAQVYCNGSYSLTVVAEGDVFVWGHSRLAGAAEEHLATHGLKGDEEYVPDVETPTRLKKGFGLQKVRVIAAGFCHCLAITEEAVMFAWGDGTKGQLGNGSLKCSMDPQPISHPTDVKSISAGEEHSACIIGGGESYTWGNAEGGRLGQGGCLTEGNQLQPKQVAILDSEEDVLLRSVSCGSQHTALVTEDHELLTFGTGWFGRLGQGDMDNRYSPTFIRADTKVAEVHCAMYHTCIVDLNRMLWVCGRDTSICVDGPDGSKHCLEPVPFQPFWDEPRRTIVTLATCDQHTLAVTARADDASPELWVWGRNNWGQLGLADHGTPWISSPWRLRIPGLDRQGKKPNYDFVAVATGSHHSLCIVKPKQRKSQAQAPEPVVYAWGLKTHSRLGLDLRQAVDPGGVVKKKEKQTSNTMPPGKVDDGWKPQIEDDDDFYPDELHSQTHLLSIHQPSRSWLQVQEKLYRESPHHKKAQLEEKGEEVSKLYVKFMNEILTLWDKPEANSGDITEWNIRQKEREVEAQYIRTLKALDLAGSTSGPRLDGRIQTDKDVLLQLHRYEELLWILQQQPCYMANFAARLIGKRDDDQEAMLFHRVSQQLFADMKNSRTRNLFKALLKLTIEREMLRANSVSELFDPTKSRVSQLFTQFCSSPYFLDKVAKPIIDPDVKDSLVYNIIRYTLSKDGEHLRYGMANQSGEGKTGSEFITGVFAASKDEYEEVDNQDREARGIPSISKELKKIRQFFQDELKDFNSFVCKAETTDAGKGEDENAPMKVMLISEFIAKFIDVTLADEGCKDIQMLLVSAYNTLTSQRYAITFRDQFGGDQWTPGVCSPLSSLIISSILGGILEKLLQPGPYGLMRAKIIERAQAMEFEIFKANYGDKAKPGRSNDEEWQNEQPHNIVRRVEWNISRLAMFFRRVVHKNVWEIQYPNAKEEKESRDRAEMLTDFVNEKLLHVLQETMEARGRKIRKYAEDTTETDMTVDFYTTHFSMDKPRVWLPTADLLQLTNVLYHYMHEDVHDSESQVIRIDKLERDRLCQLVNAILPKRKTQNQGEEAVVPWDKDGMIWIAEKVGEWHNFAMRARFLEFHNTGPEEPTFCEVSGAPIPRSLAKESQKGRSGVRVVKPYRDNDDRGPPMDDPLDSGTKDIYPFVELELLLEELSGSADGVENYSSRVRYPVVGSTFTELRGGFEDIQKRVTNEMQGRLQGSTNLLLQKLERAKHMVDKVRETHDASALHEHIDRKVRRRAEHHNYLDKIMKGCVIIDARKKQYKKKLKDHYKKLCQIVSLTEICDLPDEIICMAQQHTQRLAFNTARRIKVNTRKDAPTPAQKILEQLVRNTPEGKITDELKNMVGVPARVFTLQALTKKGVIRNVNDKIPKHVQKNLTLVFQYEDEGWQVQVKMGKTLLKEFKIVRQEIALMETGGKNAIMPYGDEFLSLSSFKLRRLLAIISAEGGL